ncbi:MAG: AMP phosphorylase [Candidatus Woesearchaeota archaeon]
MKLKLKEIDIDSGYNVCFMNKKDADHMDLRHGERLKISSKKSSVTCIVDISKSKRIISPGYIGLLTEAFRELNLKEDTIVKVNHVDKPVSLHYIKKKLKGERLEDHEIYAIIKDIVDGNFSDVEITYFVSACYIHEMSMKETVSLTNAIINTGDTIKFRKFPVVDKHCIGGVAGNRTTMIVVPLLASLGYTMPKTSARSITSPAGTSDTVEVLCPVSLSVDKIKEVVDKTNGCLVWGGGVNMAPADDRIIKVEHPVSLDPTGQLLASIMAKKKAVSATHLLVDIPYGKGAKIEDYKRAESLKEKFEKISKELVIKTKVVLTDGSQPVGNGIGPALEARDVLWVFERDERAPMDLEEKGIEMAAHIIELTKKATFNDAVKICRELMDSGKAQQKFKDIIKAQGGNTFESSKIELAKYKKDVLAVKSGIITSMNNKIISRIARICGAPGSKRSGLYLYGHVGDRIEKGSPIMTLYSENKDKLEFAYDFYKEYGGVKLN